MAANQKLLVQVGKKKRNELLTCREEEAEEENAVDADNYENDGNSATEHELINQEIDHELPPETESKRFLKLFM